MSGAFDPEVWTKRLVERLIEDAALDDSTLIRSGRDDLLENAGSLYRTLSGLPDRERESAYRALYFVIRGAHDVAGSTTLARIDGMRQLDERKTARMRSAKAGKSGARRRGDVIAAVMAEQKKPKPLKAVLPEINARLKAEGLEEIALRTLQRLSRQP